jgi:hypothetical protein
VMLRQRLAFGTRPKTLVRYLGWVSLVDVLLAPVGLVAAVAPAAFLAVIPLMALLRLFAHERNARVEQALELSAAYRRTAVLLGEVVELDDAYTGAHSGTLVSEAPAMVGRDSRRPLRDGHGCLPCEGPCECGRPERAESP